MSDSNSLTPRARQMFTVVEKFLASGLSQKVFCQQEGIVLTTFGWWFKQYRQAQNPRPKASLPATTKTNSFIPLVVNPPASADPPTRCVIEFPNGVVVRLTGAVSPQMLVHLIQTVGD